MPRFGRASHASRLATGLLALPLLSTACSSGGDGIPDLRRTDGPTSAGLSAEGSATNKSETPATTGASTGAPAPVSVIKVVGSQWQWAFNYLEGPANRAGAVYDVGSGGNIPTLYLPQGEQVRFELISLDVIHAFFLPSFLQKVNVIPQRMTTFEIVPTTLGEYDGQCAELCGADHSRMRLKVKVVTPADYQQHLADLKAEGHNGAVSNCQEAGSC